MNGERFLRSVEYEKQIAIWPLSLCVRKTRKKAIEITAIFTPDGF